MANYIARVKDIGVVRGIGVIATVFGCVALVSVVVPLLSSLNNADDLKFTIMILPWMATPCVLSIFYGIHLYMEQTKSNIKCTTAILTLFLTSFVGAYLEEFGITTGTPTTIFSVLVFFPIYIPVSVHLMNRQGLKPAKLDFVTKRTVLLTSWVICIVGMTLRIPTNGLDKRTDHDTLVQLLFDFIPIIAALLLFRFGKYYIKKLESHEEPQRFVKGLSDY